MHTGDRLPVELGQAGLPVLVGKAEGVHAKTLHGSEGAGNASIAHVPEHVVGGLGVQRHEVPERVVCRLRLRDLTVGLGLSRVNDVGKLDAVLNEEHRDVVADQVEVAFVGVELDRESAGVTHRVGRPARTQDRREPAERLRLLALAAQEAGLGDRRRGAVGLEHSVRRGTTGVHDAFGDALVVEVRDLLPQVEVLEK
jgi:hypothetical protein